MKASIALATFASLAAAASGHAQSVGHFAPNSKLVPGNIVAKDMGVCLLQKDRRHAVALVDVDPASPGFARLAREVDQPMIACLKGARSATISTFYLRGAISEALLRENDGALLKAASAVAAVPAQRVAASDDRTIAPAVVDCAVRADPADAGAIVAADAATPKEMAAFRQLAPALQACAPETGAVTLRPPTVRPGVAIALYRLGRGAAVPSSNGAN